MKIGSREFDFKHKTYIMGILNVTPDSFSDGGHYSNIDEALRKTEQMIKEGADIIDVGGESTRPGHKYVSEKEEMHRILPVLEQIKKHFDIPVSLDTYKSEVAVEGVRSGADLINDVWGLKWDGTMASAVSSLGVPVCIMHNRKNNHYKDYLTDVKNDLMESVSLALDAGIGKENIILDPGIGFAKDLSQNLLLMNHLEVLTALPYPILLGTSRKSMIGLTLDLPVDQREEGTMVTTVMGRMKGCSIFRVHNVKANVRALRMTEVIMEAN